MFDVFDTFLAWKLLMLPSHALGAPNFSSLRALDGNTIEKQYEFLPMFPRLSVSHNVNGAL